MTAAHAYGKRDLRSVVAALAAPAFGQTVEFYVVQDTATKKCTIVDKKPTVSTMTVVSPSGTVYKTRTEAEAEAIARARASSESAHTNSSQSSGSLMLPSR